MMPEKYKKLCIKCSREFESKGNRHCPHCGSDAWVFVDDNGRQKNFFAEALARRKAAVRNIRNIIEEKSRHTSTISDEEADELIHKFYPEVMRYM
jgi:hypothetical protein